MKPIDHNIRTHVTIQKSKYVRNATKKTKKISEGNYQKAYLKKIDNNVNTYVMIYNL